jgi:FkbM family methyltransferase
MTFDELCRYTEESGGRFWNDAGNHWLNDRFSLHPESRCIDVGGYLGNWTAYITSKFDCYVDVYEPIKQYFEHCASRFAGNPKIRIFNSGLEAYTGETHISFMNEGSSLYFGNVKNGPKIFVIDADMAVDRLGSVDLMAINGEGCEYNVLDRLIGTGEIIRVRELLVQFHNFYPDAENLRNAIREKLNKTHRETMCYPFTWESWRIR